MKNIKYLSFVSLGCALLLLTGCGTNTYSLSCTIKRNFETQTYEMKFNENDDQFVSLNGYIYVVYPDYVNDDKIDDEVYYIKKNLCGDSRVKNCRVSRKGNEIEVRTGFVSSFVDDINEKYTKDEIIKKIENAGYTCE